MIKKFNLIGSILIFFAVIGMSELFYNFQKLEIEYIFYGLLILGIAFYIGFQIFLSRKIFKNYDKLKFSKLAIYGFSFFLMFFPASLFNFLNRNPFDKLDQKLYFKYRVTNKFAKDRIVDEKIYVRLDHFITYIKNGKEVKKEVSPHFYDEVEIDSQITECLQKGGLGFNIILSLKPSFPNKNLIYQSKDRRRY